MPLATFALYKKKKENHKNQCWNLIVLYVCVFDLSDPVQWNHFKTQTGFTQGSIMYSWKPSRWVFAHCDPNAFLHFNVDSLVQHRLSHCSPAPSLPHYDTWGTVSCHIKLPSMFLCHTEARSNPRTPLRAASMLCSICHGPDVLSVMSFQMTYASVYQDKQAFSLKSFKINTQEACLLNCIHMCPHFHCTLFESILHHNVFYGASLYCTSSPQWRSLDPLQVPGFMNTM